MPYRLLPVRNISDACRCATTLQDAQLMHQHRGPARRENADFPSLAGKVCCVSLHWSTGCFAAPILLPQKQIATTAINAGHHLANKIFSSRVIGILYSSSLSSSSLLLCSSLLEAGAAEDEVSSSSRCRISSFGPPINGSSVNFVPARYSNLRWR